MAAGHGGARPGAGRKPKREKYEKQIGKAEQTLANAQEEAAQMLLALMRGGKQRVIERWEPAGMLFVESAEDILNKDGEPTGKMRRRKVLAFPDLNKEKMVLIERRVEELEPDRAATVAILDRISDKPPTQPPSPQQVLAAVKALIGVDIDKI